MEEFAELISALESSNKTSAKTDALVHYFATAPEKDKLWVVALFTGKRPKRSLAANLMKDWAMEIADIPAWLFVESYAAVGDLGETLSLLLPPPIGRDPKSLSQLMDEILELPKKSAEEKKEYVISAWQNMDYTERFIFNKLIGGSFRIGVSGKMLVNALAKFSGQESSAIIHAISGKWNIDEVSFEDLAAGNIINPDQSKPYPFCLAFAMDKELPELGDVKDWVAEYKWDGIRGQIIKRGGEVFIWSRGEELITEQFPEIKEFFENFEGDFVIDGEILAIKNGEVLNFTELQKRLNRKSITKKMLEEIPAGFYAYDILELDGGDLRGEIFEKRRSLLLHLFENKQTEFIKISAEIIAEHWEDLAKIRENSREINAEGLMLKSKNSLYHSGRKRGDWWKWKINPLTMDAVLIYAQKGAGRRSGYYTDYTFAVRDGEKLVTVAKAYSGLTDKEIMEVSKFVNANAVEKFGPVRTVKPELVFEIAFEGIGLSNRHKSGVAVRFPRILRWRKDKTVDDIDTIETVKSLIK